MIDETVAYMGWGISAQEQIDGFRKEVRELKAENAKLKQELEAVGTAAYLYGRNDLKAENAKLRELCGEMLLYIAYPYVCVKPSVLVERARELGVEVDQ